MDEALNEWAEERLAIMTLHGEVSEARAQEYVACVIAQHEADERARQEPEQQELFG